MPPPDPAPPPDPTDATPRRPWLLAVLISAGFFAAVAPTLRWQEFSGGSENLVVETVLEMRRGGPWLIPTLLDVPRVTKPPLTAWLTAAAVKGETVARLTSRDQATRDAAFRELAWQVRWPSLLSSCAMLLATYALARNLGLGPRVALASAAVCGSTILFLRFARGATTDVQLALWVTVANAFLALAFFRGRPWAGCLGAGIALGLAFMSKGPVALVQTLVPFALLLAWRRWATAVPPSPGTPGEGSAPRTSPWLPPLAGVAAMLLVGLPWYAWVVRRHPDILHAWRSEVTRVGATDLPPDPWYTYLVLLPWTVPWLPWFVAGLWVAALQAVRRAGADRAGVSGVEHAWRDGTVAALWLVVAPIAVMSLFKDKNERYLLPMLPPAALLAARAAVGWWQTRGEGVRRDVAGRVVEGVHWVMLAGLAIAGPFFIQEQRKVGSDPWTSHATAYIFALAGLAIITVAWAYRLRRRGGGAVVGAAVAATAAVLLLLQFPAIHLYGHTATSDLKPVADAVWADYPDARVYQYEPGRRTRVRIDLPIYLGRSTRATGAADLPRAPTDRPQVVVVLARHADVTPPFPPAWKEFASGGGRKGGWRAYVLPAAPERR